jgi:hypothetical protein
MIRPSYRVSMGLLITWLVVVQCNFRASGREHDLCVHKFTGIELTEASIDQVLAQATSILQVAAQTVSACSNVVIKREGTISTWNDELPRSVALSRDFARLVATPCVKIVQRISWCGGPVISGGALGCSPIPGNSMVVTAAYAGFSDAKFAQYQPITWLHELGHTLGLQHSLDSKNFMTPGITPDTTKLTLTDCRVIAAAPGQAPVVIAAASRPRNASRTAAALPKILPASAGRPTVADARAEVVKPVPLEDFVKETFGKADIPKAEAYRADREKLEALLLDPAFAKYRNNIVGILSVVGTPDTIPVLEKYLQTPITDSPAGPETLAHFAALTAIGTIANRFKLPDNNVKILKSAQDQKFWDPVLQSDAATANLDEGGRQALTRDLSVQAVHGYALTGTKKALNYLKDMKSDLKNAAVPEEVRQERNEVLDQALKLNTLSAKKGALQAFEH